MRRVACLALVVAAVLGLAASSWGSSAGPHWKLTNLVRVARHHFHDYVGIRPIRLTPNGTVYWTAYEQGTDGKTLEVFSWKHGLLRDLGSPGAGLAVADVNDRTQFVVFTARGPVACPGTPCPGPPPPPMHSYLWQDGKLLELGSLGGGDTGAFAINDSGQIVGSSQIAAGERAPFHAFLWQNGKMTDLGAGLSDAFAINDEGQVTGSRYARGKPERAFVWDRGKLTNLGALGGGGTRPTAINGRGEVIGESSGTAFVWEAGRMERLGKLDLSGYPLVCRGKQATSCAPSCPGPRCGLWGSVPKAIDDRGDVVGFTQTNVGASRAFLWRNGKLVDLGTLGGRSSEALAVADDGTVVGTTDTRLVPWTAEQAPRPRPFVWRAGRMTELPVDYPSPSQATAITPSGSVILGAGGYPSHQALVWTRG